jgi:hypothetical protein
MIDEMELIGAFRSGVREPDEETEGRARATLLDVIRAERTPDSRGEARPRVRRLRVVAGFAAVLLIVFAISLLFLGRGGPSASAAEVLRSQSRLARMEPALWPVGSGQFLYQERIEWTQRCEGSGDTRATTCSTSGDGAFTHRIWIAPDGSGRECFIGLRGALGPPCGDDAAGMLTPIDLSRLPIDPSDLLAEARAGTLPGIRPGPGASNIASGLFGLLVQPTASPELRAALYTAAASLPETQLLGQSRDEIGRPGIAIAFSAQSARFEVILDPKTSNVLETKTMRADPPTGPETWVVFQVPRVVDVLGERT